MIPLMRERKKDYHSDPPILHVKTLSDSLETNA